MLQVYLPVLYFLRIDFILSFTFATVFLVSRSKLSILFIFDASETCGFHLENQYNLLKQIEKIFEDKSKKIVMLAGPSSSGKTTTAKLLSE